MTINFSATWLKEVEICNLLNSQRRLHEITSHLRSGTRKQTAAPAMPGGGMGF
jgi:hypothetical protein